MAERQREYQGTWMGQKKHFRFWLRTAVEVMKELADIGVVDKFKNYCRQDKKRFVDAGPSPMTRAKRVGFLRITPISEVLAKLDPR